MLLKFETESEWLAARASDVTSTEIAALFGLSDYKSRLRLWHEKRGDIEREDLSDNPFAVWGRRLQLPVGFGICQDEGFSHIEDMTLFYFRHPHRPLGASMDFVACDDNGQGVVEVKNVTFFRAENGWTEAGAPLDYEFQLQTQLHLAVVDGFDVHWGRIAALSGDKKTKVLRREYDKELGAIIDEEVDSFARSLKDNKPPAPDYTVDSAVLRKLQGPVRVGDIVDLSQNNRAMHLLQLYMSKSNQRDTVGESYNSLNADMNEIKAELHNIMGAVELAHFGDWILSAPVQQVEEKFVDAYSFRRFDIKKSKRGKSRNGTRA